MVRAWEGFQYKEYWQALQKRGMLQDFSWTRSAEEYVKVYGYILGFDILEALAAEKAAEPPTLVGSAS